MNNVVVIDLEILAGTPVITGTRVPAEPLIDYLKRERSIDYFLDQFLTMRRVQVDQLLETEKLITIAQLN